MLEEGCGGTRKINIIQNKIAYRNFT